MADSHLPNSHPDVTPAWKPLGYKTIPLRDALMTTLVDGTDANFSGYLPLNWCVPGVAGPAGFGGYCASLILATSQKYFATTYRKKNQPDPIHVHIQYLDALPPGAISVVIRNIKLGTKQSVIQVELKASQSPVVSVLSLVTMGNFSENGPTINTPLFDLPDIKECRRWTDAMFYHASPTSSQYRSWTRKGGPNPLWSPEIGQNKRDMWVKLDNEGEVLDLVRLGTLIDQIPSLPLNYEKRGLLGITKWAFPTVCLNIDIRRDPKGEEFLLQRVVMNECTNGRFDMEVKIIDVKGRLVATSSHSALMLPIGKLAPQKEEGRPTKL